MQHSVCLSSTSEGAAAQCLSLQYQPKEAWKIASGLPQAIAIIANVLPEQFRMRWTRRNTPASGGIHR
jgi:hypothetical protein